MMTGPSRSSLSAPWNRAIVSCVAADTDAPKSIISANVSRTWIAKSEENSGANGSSAGASGITERRRWAAGRPCNFRRGRG